MSGKRTLFEHKGRKIIIETRYVPLQSVFIDGAAAPCGGDYGNSVLRVKEMTKLYIDEEDELRKRL
jgi:hypothetical protein